MTARQRILSAVAALVLCGCGARPFPDTVLFSQANQELDNEHFAPALLDLVALVNTYPRSEYAKIAVSMLENDSRLDCNKVEEFWSVGGEVPSCEVLVNVLSHRH